MTLDEAIEHCEEMGCKSGGLQEDYKQLATWLTDLRMYREGETGSYIRKLHKLALDMLSTIEGECKPYRYNGLDEIARRYINRMRELGIEVD